MATKKKAAKKVASKKAAKKKVAVKKAAAKRGVRKVASKKAPVRKAAARKTAVKKVASKKAAKTPVRVRTRRAQAQAPEAPAIPGLTTSCFKVVSKRAGGKLTSIFAKGLLRLTYSEKFVNAPHSSLPITAFGNSSDAQRFIDRNQRNRNPTWGQWLIVRGEGVREYNAPSRRIKKIHDFGGAGPTVEGIAAELTSTMRQGSRRDGRTSKWSRGTIFLKNFRITDSIS